MLLVPLSPVLYLAMWANERTGIAITLAGAAWYAHVELSNKPTGSETQLESGEVSSDDEIPTKAS